MGTGERSDQGARRGLRGREGRRPEGVEETRGSGGDQREGSGPEGKGGGKRSPHPT